MKFILGFDPGLTTGWATGRYDDTTRLQILKSGNLDIKGVVRILRQDTPHADVVVVEKFILSGGARTPDVTGVRVEGMLELYFDEIVWQTRSDKASINDQVLKDNGYWIDKKSSNHTDGRDQNDAIKHMLVWLMRNNHRPTIEMINPKETK